MNITGIFLRARNASTRAFISFDGIPSERSHQIVSTLAQALRASQKLATVQVAGSTIRVESRRPWSEVSKEVSAPEDIPGVKTSIDVGVDFVHVSLDLEEDLLEKLL